MNRKELKHLAAAALLSTALAGCRVDTSLTPPPHCAPGQAAQRLPSHQGQMWTCAPGGPAS